MSTDTYRRPSRTKNILKAIIALLVSKLPAIVALAGMMILMLHLPESCPFAELLYVVVTILSSVVLAPLLRLLMFFEVEHHIANGEVGRALQNNTATPLLIHYWIATVICYAAVIVAFATVPK